MNAETKASVSLASFMDMDTTALPDIPTRAMLPAGIHVIQITNVEQKQLKDKEALVISYKLVSTESLANPADAVLPSGTDLEQVYFTGSEGGLGSLKELLKNLKGKVGEILQGLPGNQFRVTSKVRTWKDKQSGEMRQSADFVGGLNLLG